MATPPPLPEFVETPTKQSRPAPNVRNVPVVNNGPEFIEQPIEQAPSAPTSGSGPLAFLNNIDRGALLGILKALRIIFCEPQRGYASVPPANFAAYPPGSHPGVESEYHGRCDFRFRTL
jgi:hypothetical protein